MHLRHCARMRDFAETCALKAHFPMLIPLCSTLPDIGFCGVIFESVPSGFWTMMQPSIKGSLSGSHHCHVQLVTMG